MPVEQVQHNGQVQPAFIGPQIGDIGNPDLIRGTGLEESLKQVGRHRQAVAGVCCGPIASFLPGDPAAAAATVELRNVMNAEKNAARAEKEIEKSVKRTSAGQMQKS